MGNISLKTEKQRRSKNGKALYIDRPLSDGVFGEGIHFTPKERVIASALYSYSSKGYCDFSYEKIRSRFHCSYSTTRRALVKLLDGAFSRGKKLRYYRFDGIRPDPNTNPFVREEEWMFHAMIPVAGKWRVVTPTEIDVLSLLLYYEKKRWSTSQNYIAGQLGIAKSTASEIFNRFKKIKLISAQFSGANRERASNHHTRAFYKVDKTKLRQMENEILYLCPVKASGDAENDRISRDRYYSRVQDLEAKRIRDLKSFLGSSYERLDRAVRELVPEEARAEVYDDRIRLEELRQEKMRRATALRCFLEEHGYTERDLTPHIYCKECNDTGVRSNGRFCDCWRRRS